MDVLQAKKTIITNAIALSFTENIASCLRLSAHVSRLQCQTSGAKQAQDEDRLGQEEALPPLATSMDIHVTE